MCFESKIEWNSVTNSMSFTSQVLVGIFKAGFVVFISREISMHGSGCAHPD